MRSSSLFFLGFVFDVVSRSLLPRSLALGTLCEKESQTLSQCGLDEPEMWCRLEAGRVPSQSQLDALVQVREQVSESTLEG